MARKLIFLALLFLFPAVAHAVLPCNGGTQQLAFPGAEGYGRCATAWRTSPTIIYITNLNSTGAGSFAACVTASGPRICIPRVAGWVDCDPADFASTGNKIRIENGSLYFAGQLAPGQFGLRHCQLQIGDHNHPTDIVLRFFRSYLGIFTRFNDDAFGMKRGNDIIIDHNTWMWGTDTTANIFSSGSYINGVTVQHSLIAEPLDCAKPPVNESACVNDILFLVGGLQSPLYNVTLFQNMIVGPSLYRFPEMQQGVVSMTENVMSGWYNTNYAYQRAAGLGAAGFSGQANLIRNFVKATQLSVNGSAQYDGWKVFVNAGDGPSSAYFENNWHSHVAGCAGSVCSPDAAFCTSCGSATEVRSYDLGDSPYGSEPTITTAAGSAVAACEASIAEGGAGASGYIDEYGAWVYARDSQEDRIINAMQGCNTTTSGTPGSMVVQNSDVCTTNCTAGWPNLVSTSVWPDVDTDGMSDTWEAGVCPGGDCTTTGDHALTGCPGTGGNGYTDWEEFANGACPYVASPGGEEASDSISYGVTKQGTIRQ